MQLLLVNARSERKRFRVRDICASQSKERDANENRDKVGQGRIQHSLRREFWVLSGSMLGGGAPRSATLECDKSEKISSKGTHH